jgi:hypothetical protein
MGGHTPKSGTADALCGGRLTSGDRSRHRRLPGPAGDPGEIEARFLLDFGVDRQTGIAWGELVGAPVLVERFPDAVPELQSDLIQGLSKYCT